MPVSLSSFQSEPKFRVAICGAGIAGLILAITIGRYDPSIPIDLYEAHDSIDSAGVGITLWKRTHEIIIELGLFEEFKQIFTPTLDDTRGESRNSWLPVSVLIAPSASTIRRSDIRKGGYTSDHRVQRNIPSFMHRQHMVAVLERNIPASCTAHPKKRLVNYRESEQQDTQSMSPIRLEFADGTIATTDVLIGADGIRSAARKTMFETASEDNIDDNTDLKQYTEAVFTGLTVYRCLIPAETLRRENPENLSLSGMTAYHGKGRFCITYPIAKGSIINLGATVGDPNLTGTDYEGHWVSDATRDELVGYFDDFEPDARTVVKLCEKPTKWGMHVVKPLPFCVRKRVALIGDACHAMTPHFGAGAGQAIEDAFILGRLIAHPLTTLSRIQDALRIYEEIRLPISRSVASISLSSAWMYLFMAPGYYDGTRREDDLDDNGISAYEREGMQVVREELSRRWDSLNESSGALQAWNVAELKLQVLQARL